MAICVAWYLGRMKFTRLAELGSLDLLNLLPESRTAEAVATIAPPLLWFTAKIA